MSSSQLLPRMKRELEILERDTSPGIVCYPVDDSFMRFCAQIKGPKDTPYEEGTFKVDVQIPARYPLEPPKMQFVTPIYHPNIDDAGRICLDLLKMPPNGSWKPSLNISTTLTSLSLLMAEPNPDDPLVVEIASEYKELRSLFLHKAREATIKYAVEGKESHNSKNIEKSEISKTIEDTNIEMSNQNDLQSKSASKNEDVKFQNEDMINTPGISKLLVNDSNDSQRSNPKPFSTQNRKRRLLIHSKAKDIKNQMVEPINNSKSIEEKKRPFADLSNQLVNNNKSVTSQPSSPSSSEVKKSAIEQQKPFDDLTNQIVKKINSSEIMEPFSENQTIEQNEQKEQKEIHDYTTNQLTYQNSDVPSNQGLETKSTLNTIKSQFETRPLKDITQHIHNVTNTTTTTTVTIAYGTHPILEINNDSRTINKTEKKRNLLRMKQKDEPTVKKIKN